MALYFGRIFTSITINTIAQNTQYFALYIADISAWISVIGIEDMECAIAYIG
jgi:hypothetical protein